MSGTTSPRRRRGLGAALFGLWLLVLVASAFALAWFPTAEPFAVESVVLSFALLYGFGSWPVAPAVGSISAFGVFAAFVMIPRQESGELPPALLIEIVAPVVLAAAVIFHVRRRDQAVRRAELMAEADRRRAAVRERLARMTSHEQRTPLTIAMGYVEQLLATETARDRHEDLRTVRDELVQLSRVCDRLVRAVALDLGPTQQPTDVLALLEEVRRRWEGVVAREFVVVASARSAPIDAGRLRAALDTLVENSVRYTGPGQRIRLFCVAESGWVGVGVADAGSGLSAELIAGINAGRGLSGDGEAPEEDPSSRLRDTYSQTGFGLRLVAEIVASAGGRLVADNAEEGGAKFTLLIPTRIDAPDPSGRGSVLALHSGAPGRAG